MIKKPQILGIHAEPSTHVNWILAALPFIVIVAVYIVASEFRHAANPADKLLPSFLQMFESAKQLAFETDKRTGEILLWTDTIASLRRLAMGVGLASITGLLLGLNMGMLPGVRALKLSVITFISMVPPLAILPIMFIMFGVGEFAKAMLIFLGLFPIITRDVYLTVRKVPREQIIKALTLGASGIGVIYRIVLPQIIPRLIDSIRLSLGSAWLFLIAAEAIASTGGLGYRIFLVRRYMAMDIILPYVLWITVIGFTMDYILRLIVAKKYSWYVKGA